MEVKLDFKLLSAPKMLSTVSVPFLMRQFVVETFINNSFSQIWPFLQFAQCCQTICDKREDQKIEV